MARPKKVQTDEVNVDNKIKSTDSKATTSITKMFGDDILVNGQSLVDNPKEIISLSPAFDASIGGGLQVGSLAVFAGPPRCGKTTTALHFAAKCQAKGRRVVYVNAEHRLGARDLNGIPGLKPEEFDVIQSCRGKIMTAQDYLTAVLTYLAEDTDLLVIIDSFSILSDSREMTDGMGTQTRGGNGVILGQFCRLATPLIPVNNHIVIGIAQLYSNTSGQGKKYIVSMGKKVDYALYTSLYCEYFENWNIGSAENQEIVGQIGHWRVERSPIGSPGGKLSSYLRYGGGIDELQEYLVFATDLAIVNKAGSWYSFDYGEDGQTIRGQGVEKFRQALLETPAALESLKLKVTEMML